MFADPAVQISTYGPWYADQFGWNIRREMGFEFEELEGDAFHELEPAFKGQADLGVRLPHHGSITDPGAYVTALAEYATGQGAELVISDVTDVDIDGGHVSSVTTSTGTLACDELVLATGVWSGPLAEKLGTNVPMESERGYHIELINPSIQPNNPVMVASGKFVATPMEGRLRCAGIVEFGGLDAPPSLAPFELLERQIKALMPGITYDRIERWMGHRPAPTDSIPVIGPFSNAVNAYGAFGHHHIGLTGGPKTGRMIADMVANRASNADLSMYSPSRFD